MKSLQSWITSSLSKRIPDSQTTKMPPFPGTKGEELLATDQLSHTQWCWHSLWSLQKRNCSFRGFSHNTSLANWHLGSEKLEIFQNQRHARKASSSRAFWDRVLSDQKISWNPNLCHLCGKNFGNWLTRPSSTWRPPFLRNDWYTNWCHNHLIDKKSTSMWGSIPEWIAWKLMSHQPWSVCWNCEVILGGLSQPTFQIFCRPRYLEIIQMSRSKIYEHEHENSTLYSHKGCYHLRHPTLKSNKKRLPRLL